MSRVNLFASLAVGVAIALIGCNAATAADTNAPQPAAHPVAAAAETPEGLAELSAKDRALAKKQKICPVTGEELGSMGKPYKTTVKNQTVFLCCKGCEKELKKNPDKYLAKLNKNNKKDNKK